MKLMVYQSPWANEGQRARLRKVLRLMLGWGMDKDQIREQLVDTIYSMDDDF